MTDEQLHLMARLLIGLYASIDFALPYHAWGVDVGQCRYCGAVGTVRHLEIRYDHTPECLTTQVTQLQESLKEQGQ